MASMRDRVSEGWNSIKERTSSLWGGIKDHVVSIAGEMREKFSSTIASVAESFSEKLRQMKETTSAGLSNIASSVFSALGSIKEKVSTGVGNIISGLSSAFSNVVSGLKEKLSGIGQVFTDLAKNALSWGRDIIANLISGIASKISDLVSKVKDVANTVKDFLGFSEPEKGPLSDFHTYMPDMIDLMAEGIRGNMDRLKGPMAELAKTMILGQMGAAAQADVKGPADRAVDIGTLTEAVLKYLPRLANQKIVLDSGALVGELADGMNRQLGKAYL